MNKWSSSTRTSLEPDIPSESSSAYLTGVEFENAQKMYFMQQFCYSPFISKATHQEGVSNFMFLIDQITLGIKEGVIRDYPPEIILSITSSGLMTAILAAAREKDPQKQHNILKLSIDLILYGVLQE